jgi:hypothetical protein
MHAKPACGTAREGQKVDLPTVTQMPNSAPDVVLFRADHGAAQHLGAYRQAVVYERDLYGFTCSADMWPKLRADLTAKNVVVIELPAGKPAPPRFVRERRDPQQLTVNQRGIALVRSALAKARAPKLAPDDDPWSW